MDAKFMPDPDQEGEGHEDGGDNGKDLHDLIQSVNDAGQINVQQARYYINDKSPLSRWQ